MFVMYVLCVCERLGPDVRHCVFVEIAQLGERQTEDLKVPGSIPGRGICYVLDSMTCVCCEFDVEA